MHINGHGVEPIYTILFTHPMVNGAFIRNQCFFKKPFPRSTGSPDPFGRNITNPLLDNFSDHFLFFKRTFAMLLLCMLLCCYVAYLIVNTQHARSIIVNAQVNIVMPPNLLSFSNNTLLPPSPSIAVFLKFLPCY